MHRGRDFSQQYITGLGQVVMGTSTDLNPYRCEAPWSKTDFAYHALETRANVVIISMAWLTRSDSRVFTQQPDEPDLETLTYWCSKLQPLIHAKTSDEVIVVICSRAGAEDDALYVGTSAVLGIKDGEVSYYGLLGRGDKKLLVVDTDAKPLGKFVSRRASTRAPNDVRNETTSNTGSEPHKVQSDSTRHIEVVEPSASSPTAPSDTTLTGYTAAYSVSSSPADKANFAPGAVSIASAAPPLPPIKTTSAVGSPISATASPDRLKLSQLPQLNTQFGALSKRTQPGPHDNTGVEAETPVIPTPCGPSPIDDALRPEASSFDFQSLASITRQQGLWPSSGRETVKAGGEEAKQPMRYPTPPSAEDNPPFQSMHSARQIRRTRLDTPITPPKINWPTPPAPSKGNISLRPKNLQLNATRFKDFTNPPDVRSPRYMLDSGGGSMSGLGDILAATSIAELPGPPATPAGPSPFRSRTKVKYAPTTSMTLHDEEEPNSLTGMLAGSDISQPLEAAQSVSSSASETRISDDLGDALDTESGGNAARGAHDNQEPAPEIPIRSESMRKRPLERRISDASPDSRQRSLSVSVGTQRTLAGQQSASAEVSDSAEHAAASELRPGSALRRTTSLSSMQWGMAARIRATRSSSTHTAALTAGLPVQVHV